MDEFVPQIAKGSVGAEEKSVRLTFDKLTKGHVHELQVDGVKFATGLPIFQRVADYTSNEIPAK